MIARGIESGHAFSLLLKTEYSRSDHCKLDSLILRQSETLAILHDPAIDIESLHLTGLLIAANATVEAVKAVVPASKGELEAQIDALKVEIAILNDFQTYQLNGLAQAVVNLNKKVGLLSCLPPVMLASRALYFKYFHVQALMLIHRWN